MVHGLETIRKMNKEASSRTRLTFDPGTAQITGDWLREHADSIESNVTERGDFSVAIFVVESDSEGFTNVRVDVRDDMRAAAAIEIETGWRTSAGMETNRSGIGLYTKLNDLTALLELLARGNHF